MECAELRFNRIVDKHCYRVDAVKLVHYVKMDVKIVLVTLFIVGVIGIGEAGLVFNFHDKLRMATTTVKNVQSGQVIRVPDLECPDGYRMDKLGNCRQRL